MSEHKLVPLEAFKLIPKFDGDVRHLNLFIRKCEYVIEKFKSPEISEEYLMQVVTSRLRGDAAAFISEHGDVNDWETFKTLIKQQFDDPRSEACLAMVLENLKIQSNENYSIFYRRIQSLKSILLSKVDQTSDANMKKSKHDFYDHVALHVFLYNLPEDVITIIRMKGPTTLAEALTMVLDETTFSDQYKIRSRCAPPVRTGLNLNSGIQQGQTYRPAFGAQNFGTSVTSGTSGALFGSTSSTNSGFNTTSVKPAVPQSYTSFGMSYPTSSTSVPQAQHSDTKDK